MTTTANLIPQPQVQSTPTINLNEHAPSTAGFDALMIIGTLWLTTGQSLDAAAHTAHAVDSFFTPWHAVLYSGLGACALAMFFQVWRNQARGYRLWNAVPRGYQVAAIGIVLLSIGAVLDLIWHSIYGIEFNLVAIFSPSHFLLITSIGMIYSGLISSIWWRRKTAFTGWRADWHDYIPLLAGAVLICVYTSTIIFPFQPIGTRPGSFQALQQAANDIDNSVLIGMPSIVIQVILSMSILLMLLRRFRLLPGTVFLMIALPNLIVGGISGNFGLLPVGLIAGLLGDLLVQRLQPSPLRITQYRLAAFLIPFMFYALYFATLIIQHDLAWALPFWAGAIVIAGGIGMIVSYLIVPAPALVIVQAE